MITSVKDFSSFIGSIPGPYAVVKYSASWCGPCKSIAPFVHELSEKYTQVKFYEVDITPFQEQVLAHGVRSVPYIEFYHNGRLIGFVKGAQNLAIERGVNELLALN